jgi:hypothetical protein
MRFVFSIIAIAALLCGCHELKPPKNAVVGFTARKIGIIVGENAATQTPEITIGFYSLTYHRVPTGTTNVPNVRSSINMQQHSFSTSIIENFETGDAPPGTNAPWRLRNEIP